MKNLQKQIDKLKPNKSGKIIQLDSGYYDRNHIKFDLFMMETAERRGHQVMIGSMPYREYLNYESFVKSLTADETREWYKLAEKSKGEPTPELKQWESSHGRRFDFK